MADLPVTLSPGPAAVLATALDRERKIDRALDALGPLAGCDVLAVGPGPDELVRWRGAGARVTGVDSILDDDARSAPDGAFDTIVSTWSGFRGVDPSEVASADRLLRPSGRLLVVHDYGRDDVSRLRGDQPEYGSWSRRNGPFLANGFRVRVVHCFWTFDDLPALRDFLGDAFGAPGTALAAELKRPRLSWNVAIYHRSRGGADQPESSAASAGAIGSREVIAWA